MKNGNGVVVELTSSTGGVNFKVTASGIWFTLEK